MRLTEDQVKGFILHPDLFAREAAVHFFSGAPCDDPAVMPLVIQAVERYGWRDAFTHYNFLSRLAQADETVGWLLGQIEQQVGSAEHDEDVEFDMSQGYARALRSGLASADAAILNRHLPAILEVDTLEDEAKKTIIDRVALRSRTAEELWEDLAAFCHRADSLNQVPDDLEFADELVDALRHHLEFSGAKVLPILSLGASQDWLEIFAIRLAGELKLREAIPLMVARLGVDDDWAHEEAFHALNRTGGDPVVEELARAYVTGDEYKRMSAADVLAHVHTDLSVETLLKWFDAEENHTIRCLLLEGVLGHFATEGIEPARQFILANPKDPELLAVRSQLLPTCKIVGQTFPEFDAWAEDAKHDAEFRANWYRGELPPRRAEEFDQDDEQVYDESFPAAGTIVRDSMRVGRNDPCPCGSGKKFKKCCLKHLSAAE